tara:strand:+ start:244 stop:1038 length:795 start_codon:yes stop_codon:yes gene_type:complete
MTTSVIQDLENEDTSFKKRFGETTHHLNVVSNWVRDIEWKCHEARSTEGSNTWDQTQLTTDFFIEINTTKKAISDKRFEEMLSTPPTGWILMGMTKSRKDGVIKAQYVKEDNYCVTPIEVINERYRWLVQDKTERLVKMIESKEEQLADKISTLSQERGSRLDNAVHCIKNWRSEIPLLETLKEMFHHLGKVDDQIALECEREHLFSSNWQWELGNIFNKVCETPTISRYIYRDLGLFDPNSDLSSLVRWREGDEIPRSHIYSL